MPVGKENVINVDASKAGPGNVTCLVTTPDDGVLKSDVVKNKDQTYDVFYTPPKPGPYAVNLRYGGEPVQDSPFNVKVCVRLLFKGVYSASLTSHSMVLGAQYYLL